MTTPPTCDIPSRSAYMAAIPPGSVRCRAIFLRQDRPLSLLQSHATRADGALAARATATWRLLPGKG